MVILISATALHALIPLAVETRYNNPTGVIYEHSLQEERACQDALKGKSH